jgi:hypothetical protein
MTHLEPSRFERGPAFEMPSRSTRIRSAENVRQETTIQLTCSAMVRVVEQETLVILKDYLADNSQSGNLILSHSPSNYIADRDLPVNIINCR